MMAASSTYRTIAERVPDNDLGKGASAAEIDRAAKELGVKLPRSYVKFLREVGWFESGPLTVYGVGAGTPRHLDLVQQVRSERKAWAKIAPLGAGLVPVSPDGSGGHDCLDTPAMKAGECPVVYWDHEEAAMGYKPRSSGKTFESYFMRSAPKLERALPKLITPENALDAIAKQAKKAGIVGDDMWKRGASDSEIRAAEKELGLKFPAVIRELLKRADGFEHAGGWDHMGVGKGLAKEQSMLHYAKRLRAKSKSNVNLIPIARSWVGQLCCVDVSKEPLEVMAYDLGRSTRLRGLEPMAFETWALRICKFKLDPWHSE